MTGVAKTTCSDKEYQRWADDILMIGGLSFLAVGITGSDLKFGSFLKFMDGKGMEEIVRIFALIVGLAGLYVGSCRLFYPLKAKGVEAAAGCECESGETETVGGKKVCK